MSVTRRERTGKWTLSHRLATELIVGQSLDKLLVERSYRGHKWVQRRFEVDQLAERINVCVGDANCDTGVERLHVQALQDSPELFRAFHPSARAVGHKTGRLAVPFVIEEVERVL